MRKKWKIMLSILVVFLLWISFAVYQFFGNPYLKFGLIGKEYIADSWELHYLNQDNNNAYYLIKKYKYSKDKMLLGFGGGTSTTDHYYGLGIAEKDKHQILAPQYEYLTAQLDSKTNTVFLECTNFVNSKKSYKEFFLVKAGKLISIKDKP